MIPELNGREVKNPHVVEIVFWLCLGVFLFIMVFGIVRSIANSNAREERLHDIGYNVLHEQYPRLTPELWTIIERESRRNGIDPATTCAIIDQESNFRRYAVSRAGAKGYMQLMDKTAQCLGVDDSFDAAQNIRGGVRHYAMCLHRAGGGRSLALKMYNGGHN